eukprot:m51a1_g7483 hypothetical protein (212) ;mRNA; r:216269-217144
MSFWQIRSATGVVTIGGAKILVDPVLAPKGAFPGFPFSANSNVRWPTVDLPAPISEILEGVEAVVVTHTHLDHFDEAAAEAIPKDARTLVQDEADLTRLRGLGFTNIEVLSASGTRVGGAVLTKTECVHGEGQEVADLYTKIGARGNACGVVFAAPGEKTIYLAGDTIWHCVVKAAIDKYQPDIVIVNACDARTAAGDSLIMGKEDVTAVT